MAEGLVAIYRPQLNDLFVCVQHHAGSAFLALGLDEARQVHATLGTALSHADSVSDPLAAIPDGPSWAIRKAVAGVVRGQESDAFSAVSRFARQIEAGEADDSEPMRIALAVAGLLRGQQQTGGQA